jgi:hypothetical protein
MRVKRSDGSVVCAWSDYNQTHLLVEPSGEEIRLHLIICPMDSLNRFLHSYYYEGATDIWDTRTRVSGNLSNLIKARNMVAYLVKHYNSRGYTVIIEPSDDKRERVFRRFLLSLGMERTYSHCFEIWVYTKKGEGK